jgi:hypothetical protein
MQQTPGHFPGSVKDKGVTTGSASFEQPVFPVIESGVARDFRKIPAHEGEMVMFIHSSHRPNSAHDVFVAQLPTQGVTGVSRVYDDASRPHNSRGLSYQPRLRVIRVNGKELSHVADNNFNF